MDYVLAVRGIDGGGNLNSDYRCLGWIEVAFCFGVSFQQFAGSPFDGEERDPAFGFACFDCANDVAMLYASTELRFADEPRDGSRILSQALSQHFERYTPMLGVMRFVNGGRTAFTDLSVDRVPGDRRSHQIFSWHSANLMRIGRRGQGQDAI
jgi:hypothetical protein